MSGGTEDHLFIILGATGDLTGRKLLPALYRLDQGPLASARGRILGVSRSGLRDEDFRERSVDDLTAAGVDLEDARAWTSENLFFQTASVEAEDHRALKERIEALESEHDLPGNRAFYLALPPGAFEPVLDAMCEGGLNTAPGWTRIILEKPFGRDLASAEELDARLHRDFDEDQIYRIDHYLGKETVQNLLVFRFANPIFESLWDREHVESVHITVAEDLGVGTRAPYYDDSGALRDMVQNHLTQLLCLTAMEVPARFDSEAIRREKIKVLQSVRPIDPAEVVLGRYEEGTIGGERVPGYLQEDGVPAESTTETFAALRLGIDNWRWQGVPFYLRTGKRLPRRLTRITVTFRSVPVSLFGERGEAPSSNVLGISLQPDEGFDLAFEVKRPGEGMHPVTQQLGFDYESAFTSLPDAYETLLQDVVSGDQTLFVHTDEVESSWALYTPLLEADLPLRGYGAGTWGPEAARRLAADADHPWPEDTEERD
ncbi:MAG: glucose-6-phosphate dehydrogenase [bacterium]